MEIKLIKLKKKNKKNLNYNTGNDIRFNHLDIKEKLDGHKKEDNLFDIIKISPKKAESQEINNICNDISEKNENKKIMTKKLVYHGQIKRKRNIKNTKSLMNSNKCIPNENQKKENINRNTTKEIISKNNNDNSIYNNSSNNSNNDTIKLKTVSTNRKSKENENYFNKTSGNPIYHQITPKKTLQIHKKKIDINLKDKIKYSINYDNLNNILQKNNKFINNYTMMNFGNKSQSELPKQIIPVEEIVDNKKNYTQKIKTVIKKAVINNEENPIKKYNKNNPNTQTMKKIYDKGFKTKNYYGYDERHNLEGTINNHSYYVSVYSKKKINQKNLSTDKIN